MAAGTDPGGDPFGLTSRRDVEIEAFQYAIKITRRQVFRKRIAVSLHSALMTWYAFQFFVYLNAKGTWNQIYLGFVFVFGIASMAFVVHYSRGLRRDEQVLITLEEQLREKKRIASNR